MIGYFLAVACFGPVQDEYASPALQRHGCYPFPVHTGPVGQELVL